MPIGISGQTSVMAYGLYNYDGVYLTPSETGIPSYPLVAVQASRSTFSNNANRRITGVTLEDCLPSHFTKLGYFVDAEASWNTLKFGSNYNTRDKFNLNFNENLALIGNPGSIRLQANPPTFISGFNASVVCGTLGGTRDSTVTVHDANVSYQEYIPDVSGGVYSRASEFFEGFDSLPYRIDEYTSIFPVKELMQEVLQSNEAQVSPDGSPMQTGVVLKLTLIDYQIDVAGAGASAPSVSAKLSVFGDSAYIYAHPVAAQYGADCYLCVTSDIDYLSLSLNGLFWADVKVELYTSYAPAVPQFWDGFLNSREKA